jgi:hypothetical protein
MPLHISILKLTFDPSGSALVLLDYGSAMPDGPLHFPQRNPASVENTPDSAYPLILDGLNSAFTIKFSVAADGAASPAESMRLVLDSLIAIGARGVKPLKIEVQGISGHHWLVAQCKITDHEPWNEPVKSTARTMKQYTLTCAGISYV